jgi:hypothetical protein
MEAILRQKARRADLLLPLPRPVSSFGGRTIDRTFLFLLEADPESPRALRIRRSSREAEVIPLAAAGATPDPYGLARPGDGTLWALAAQGRELLRYDEDTGKLVESRALPGTFPGIWDLAGSVLLAKAPLRAGDALLFREAEGSLLAFGSVSAGIAGEAAGLLLQNLIACGPSEGDELPCWRVTDGSELFLVNAREETRQIALAGQPPPPEPPSRDALRDADSRSGIAQPPGILDAQVTSSETAWILLREAEGSCDVLVRTDLDASFARLRLGGRYAAILECRAGKAHLLRADGVSEWIEGPRPDRSSGGDSRIGSDRGGPGG